MSRNRHNLDFASVDTASGFTARGGGVAGIHEKIPSNDLDTERKAGSRTRLLRLDPDVATPAAHTHDYWEEIYMLEGEMIVGDGNGGERTVTSPSYACREPGFLHGPVRTETGCMMIEFSWYPDRG
jgi:hypothetical protein